MSITWKTGIALLSFVVLAMSVAAEELHSGNDYGRATLGGSIEWESLLDGEGLDGWTVNDDPWTAGAWSREGDTIIADVGGGYRARIIRGDKTWRSYELKVQMTMIKGGSAQLWFNIHDSQDHHFGVATK